MVRVKEAIIVEGRYDKNTVSQVVDGVIIETSGFGIFSDDDRMRLIRRLAESCGVIVLTDSDSAGFLIRGHIKGAVPTGSVKHAYIPDRPGKERRKRNFSKEGKLGVEGMRPDVILDALRKAGATFIGEADEPAERAEKLTKADLYALGLSGGKDSAERRQALFKRLDLPERLTANGLLEVLNALYSRDEALELIGQK